ncbi:MAG: hypothetical protein OEW45_22780, partial [Deltaproteobacteria bacterium]|nr:hypothetical protein [Deltaproteobacteria bacterium]
PPEQFAIVAFSLRKRPLSISIQKIPRIPAEKAPLEKALLESFKDPAVVGIINKWNMVMEPIGGEALTAIIAKDFKMNGELLEELGLGLYKK